MEDRLAQLQALSDAATEYVVAKFGTAKMKCVEGRHHLFSAARKAGLNEVQKAQGFYFGQHHNWVFDPVSGAIIDPTASQFGARNGVVLASTLQYDYYDLVPKEHLPHLGMQPSLQYSRWRAVKRWLEAGAEPNEEVGEEKFEWRTSKKGDGYAYFSKKVHFGPHIAEGVRSGLLFSTKKGDIHVSLVLQRRVLVDGKVYRPTRIKHLLVTQAGALLESRWGNWTPYRDPYSGLYFPPSHYFTGFPATVQEIVEEGAEAFPF